MAEARRLEGEELRTRSEELWRPLKAVLAVADAPEEDLEAARALYKRSAVETVAELGDWELALLDELGARFEAADRDEMELVNTDLLTGVHRRLGLEGEEREEGPRPGERWLGTALNSLNLLDGKDRRSVGGERKRFYAFTRDRVEGQRRRYGLPDLPDPGGQGSGSREPRSAGGSETPSRPPDRSGGAEGVVSTGDLLDRDEGTPDGDAEGDAVLEVEL